MRSGAAPVAALLLLAALAALPTATAFCEIVEPPSALPTQVNGTQVEIRLSEGHAKIVIIKEFHNPSTIAKEGQIFFPLERGHELITDLSLKVGNVVYNSSALGRGDALEGFLEASAQGQDAALVQYDDAKDVYWVAVTIPPGESRTTITTLEMPLARVDGAYAYEYRLSVDAGHSLSYLRAHVRIETAGVLEDVTVPSHSRLAVTREGEHAADLYVNSTAEAEGRDLSVRFRSGRAPLARAEEHGVSYLRLSLEATDPVFAGSLRAVPRALLFLVDTSGSMGTAGRWPIVKEAVLAGLHDLVSGESYAVVVPRGRSGRTLGLEPHARAIVSDATRVGDFLDAIVPGGSTDLTAGFPLVSRWASESASRGQQPILMVITDGVPTVNLRGVDLEKAYRGIAHRESMPVVAVAIRPSDHSAENLLRNLSHYSRGDPVPLYGGSAEGKVSEVLASLRLPVLQKVETGFAPGMETAGPRTQDLLRGGEITVAARAEGPLGDPVTVHVSWRDNAGARAEEVTATVGTIPVQPSLPRVWLLSRIHAMLAEVDAATDDGPGSALRAFATANRVVTPYSSLLVLVPRPDPFCCASTAQSASAGFPIGLGFPSLLEGEGRRAAQWEREMSNPLVTEGEVDRYVDQGSGEHRALLLDEPRTVAAGRFLTILEVDGQLVGVRRGWTYGTPFLDTFPSILFAVGALAGIAVVERLRRKGEASRRQRGRT